MAEPSRDIDYRLIISGLLELAGIGLITFGTFLITPFLGFIVAGAGLLWVARAIDPPVKPRGVIEEE